MEEESVNSSFSSTLVCCDEEDDGASAFSDRESSWTTYFEDFMASEDQRSSSARGFSSVTGAVNWSSAAVSDATSCAAWTPKAVRPGESDGYKKLRPRKKKKKKGRSLLDDDPLEDTASSPVDSPKVNELSYVDPQKKEEHMEIVQKEEEDVLKTESALEMEVGSGFDCIEGANECTELRSRGVCLIPMSMLVEYLG